MTVTDERECGPVGSARQPTQAMQRCVLCPAGCGLQLAPSGPDAHRSEYPLGESGGCCPRGSSLVELITHSRRILSAARRQDGRPRPLDLDAAVGAVAAAAGEGPAVFLLDGNLPSEEIAALLEQLRKKTLEGFDFDAAETQMHEDSKLQDKYPFKNVDKKYNYIWIGDHHLIEADGILYDMPLATDKPEEEFADWPG